MASAGTCSVLAWLSFRRIVDIPFETCVAALESWQPTGQDGELHVGHSVVRGPIEHQRDPGTCTMEVRLVRGRLRPLLRMRLDIDRWTWPHARTALELIPCQRVRPTATYFRAGHLLLDSLTQVAVEVGQVHEGEHDRRSCRPSSRTPPLLSDAPVNTQQQATDVPNDSKIRAV
jgi:hypothetical protein